MNRFIKWLFGFKKSRYRLKYWSTDFKCYQVYLVRDGAEYFRGFAANPETNFDALIKNEERLGANVAYLYWAKLKLIKK